MKIQILVFIIYIISISSFNLRQTKQRQSYDSYVFSLQWPSGYCKVNDCSINLDSLEKNALTIHGLWPSLKSGKMLQICTHGVRINEDNSELFDLMRKYWPSFKGSSKEFWTHEYNKHGYCMVQENGWDDYEDYFGNALYLYFRDYQNLLKEAFPDYKRRIIYNLDIKEMREKIQKIIPGATFKMTCQKGFIVGFNFYLEKDFTPSTKSRFTNSCSSGRLFFE